MNIDPRHPSRIAGEARPSPVTPDRVPAGPADQAPRRDAIDLSSRAEAYRRIRPHLGALPEVGRGDRVAELRALVASGAWRVDAVEIADALLRDPTTARQLGIDEAR